MKIPTVALVGKPNVGKSTLFNRIAGKRISIIEDTPGVTRDRIYSLVSYNDHKFHLIDTGGIDLGNEDFNKEIRIQASLAMDEADVIVFIVDGKDSLGPNDYLIKDMLKKSNKKVIVAINKVDSKSASLNIYSFYELGFDEYIPISAERNSGIYNLLDKIVEDFKDVSDIEYDESVIKFSVIGRPNVGKSSILNKLIDEDKAIVTDIEGTTRDIVEGNITIDGILLNIIDTAGVRETSNIVEKIGVDKSLSLINDADLIILVLNNNECLNKDDLMLLESTKNKKRIIFINKCDLKSKVSIDEEVVYGNTITNDGLDNLKSKIKELFNIDGIIKSDMNYLSSATHISTIKECLKIVDDILIALENNLTVDMLEIDIKKIWELLGNLIGDSYDEELLDNLFSKFCLGK